MTENDVRKRMTMDFWARAALLLAASAFAGEATAHHSFAMYDQKKTYVFTGVVTRVIPDSNHLLIFFAPLNESRDAVIRGEDRQPAIWTVELRGASQVAQEGVTVKSFSPGTIFSIGLHPLRNGGLAGGRGEYGLYRCPDKTPPPSGKHCDVVAGATPHGKGGLPEPTSPWPE